MNLQVTWHFKRGWGFPGAHTTKGWGSINPDTCRAPGGADLQIIAIWLMAAGGKLRLQLAEGTPDALFPSAIEVAGAVYDNPGPAMRHGSSQGRDYRRASGTPPSKLDGVTTEARLSWDGAQGQRPTPEQDRGISYEPSRHTLLRDIAHTELLTPEEYPGFEARCKAQGLSVIEVAVPDWPPAQYSPLGIVANLDDGTFGGGWWTGHHWTGAQPAVVTSQRVRYTYPDRSDIAASMAPGMAGVEHWVRVDTVARYEGRLMAGDALSGKRLAYREQVAEFDRGEHVLVRAWLRERGLDLVRFYQAFLPEIKKEFGFNPVFDVTNPEARAERDATGSYSPTEDAVSAKHLGAVLTEYERRSAGLPPRKAPAIKDDKPDVKPLPVPPQKPDRPDAVTRGIQTHSVREVANAIAAAFGGKMPRFFGGGPADTAIVALTRAGLEAYMAWSDLDKQAYIKDSGGRNFVCDDFALQFKADLARYFGVNCCGVLRGNGHDWNIVVLVGPEIVMIEPQADNRYVTDFTGIYAIDRRCEILL